VSPSAYTAIDPQRRRPLTTRHNLIRIWLPVLIWIGVIALESGFGSSANTGSMLYKAVAWIFGSVNLARFESFHHVLRKCGHFFGYGILGYLWLRAFTGSLEASRLTCAAFAIGCTFAVASVDEWHQSFSSARTGQFTDVLLDTSGAVLLVTIALLAAARRREPRAV
jgi:VanZ family protein